MDSEQAQRLSALADDFQDCQDVFFALGDNTRQTIVLTLIEAGCHPGLRVGELTERTRLSRPAVSHHLKVLKDAKILSVHKEGTKNYYFLDPTQNTLSNLKVLIDHVETVLKASGRMAEKEAMQ